MNQNKETVGKVALDLLKNPQPLTPDEIRAEALKDLPKRILEVIEDGKKKYNDDFFVVVETVKHRKLINFVINKVFHRKSCPTPNYDQSVWKYNFKDQSDEFIWVIPARDKCHELRDNALFVPPDQKELLQFVLAFNDGTLYKLCKKLNNEKDESIEICK